MLLSFIRDCQYLLKNRGLLLELSYSDISIKYRRSVIGPFWLVFTTFISVAALGYVWSILFDMDREIFVPAFCVGLVIWHLISNTIIESGEVFSKNTSILKNMNHPALLFIVANMIKNFIIFLHNSVVIVVVLAIYPPEVNLGTWLIFPGLLLTLLNLTWITGVLSVISCRYRDISPAIVSIMPVMFFLSPVIYKPDQLGLKASLVWLNPFTYLITLIRDPMIGHGEKGYVLTVGILGCVFGFLLLAALLARTKDRIVYWI